MHFSEYSSQFWIKIFNFNPKLKFTNRLPAEFAFAEEFAGNTESRPAAYSNVREEQSTGITHKLPAKVEFCRKSNDNKVNILC
ncbi:palindromic element RPE1 domain-containing protein [Candidatus Tisiphia endosymbiont of Stenodema calcarata]|uniref:palindromic element RPE1 domain-containing protein n=1 Tax=Candidatus Tisiphia endosymbiont of Stenodema calcarata TaxID=3139337 RepID=UPI003CCB2035